MRLAIFFIFLLTSLSTFACEDQKPCALNAMEMFLPEVQRYPAPNIRIEKIIYQTELGDVNNKISLDKLKHLKGALTKFALSSFKDSKTSFEVLAQFKLTTTSGSSFKLQSTGGETENAMLSSFYDSASKLTEYNSIKDVVHVFIQYKISPVVLK